MTPEDMRKWAHQRALQKHADLLGAAIKAGHRVTIPDGSITEVMECAADGALPDQSAAVAAIAERAQQLHSIEVNSGHDPDRRRWVFWRRNQSIES